MNIREFARPLSDIQKAGWEAEVEGPTGERIQMPSGALFFSQNTRMGVGFAYGQRPEGYDGWSIREPNGGGSVTVPYLWLNGELYIGVIRQERKGMGGYSTEVSRGFSLPQESHEETARREFEAETGASTSLNSRIRPLGRGTNPNSAYFISNLQKGEGVRFFGIEIKPDEVVLRRKGRRFRGFAQDGKKMFRVFVDDPTKDVYKFTPQLQGEIKELNEKIKPEGIRFMHASLLGLHSGDGFTVQAIGKIYAQKHQRK